MDILDDKIGDNQTEWENWSDYQEYLRYCKVSWKIIEAKYIYYHLNGEHPLSIKDYQYDLLEKEYVDLCGWLEEEPVNHCVGIDLNRPSVKVVIKKLLEYRI